MTKFAPKKNIGGIVERTMEKKRRMEKITDEVSRRLNEVRADIAKHPRSVDINLAAKRIYDVMRQSHNITTKEWAKIQPDVMGQLRFAVLSQTKQFRAMDAHARQQARQSVARASKSPKGLSKIQATLEHFRKHLKVPKKDWGALKGALFVYLGGEKSPFKGFLKKILGLKDKPAPNKNNTGKKPGNNKNKPNQNKRKPNEGIPNQSDINNLFSRKGLRLEYRAVDLKSLNDRGIKTADIAKYLEKATHKNNGYLTKIKQAIDSTAANFNYHLTDLLIQYIDYREIPKMEAIIRQEASMKNNPGAIRAFIDLAIANPKIIEQRYKALNGLKNRPRQNNESIADRMSRYERVFSSKKWGFDKANASTDYQWLVSNIGQGSNRKIETWVQYFDSGNVNNKAFKLLTTARQQLPSNLRSQFKVRMLFLALNKFNDNAVKKIEDGLKALPKKTPQSVSDYLARVIKTRKILPKKSNSNVA